MTKKKLKLNIEGEIIDKIKKEIPNISKFTEDYYKQYLNQIQETNNTTKTLRRLNEIEDTIKQLNLEKWQLTTDYKNTMKMRSEEGLSAWRKLYSDYIIKRTLNPQNLNERIEEVAKLNDLDWGSVKSLIDFFHFEINGVDLRFKELDEAISFYEGETGEKIE